MICPIRIDYVQTTGDNNDKQDYHYQECVKQTCAWWDAASKLTGQCCIKTLSKLSISGGVNTHPY